MRQSASQVRLPIESSQGIDRHLPDVGRRVQQADDGGDDGVG